MADTPVVRVRDLGPRVVVKARDLGGTKVTATTAIVSGPRGLSAYDVAVAAGFVGTEAEWLESLKGEGGGAVGSVNGQTGDVVLDAGDVGADPAGTAQATVGTAIAAITTRLEELLVAIDAGDDADQAGLATLAAQLGQLAASLATVATTGKYSDLTGRPTIPSTPGQVGADPAGTAAAAVEAHRTGTTDVHGIVDTTALATKAGAQQLVDDAVEPVLEQIGDLAVLDTTARQSLVAAINEVLGTTPTITGSTIYAVGDVDPAGDPQSPSYGDGVPADALWFDTSTETA